MVPSDKSAVQTQICSLLVVEDEEYLRQGMVKMLHKAGSQVFEAADGSTAIDLLRANRRKFDVILLDMTIPRGSSRVVVTEAAKDRPDIRVILTSAYSPEMIPSTMNSPQICTFIRKPYQLGDLVSALRNVLSSQGVDSRVKNQISA